MNYDDYRTTEPVIWEFNRLEDKGGDIPSNPGPVSPISSLNKCTLNIRSMTNPLYQRSAGAEIIWPGPARFQKIIFRSGPFSI